MSPAAVCFDLFHTLVTAGITEMREAERLGVEESAYRQERTAWHSRRMTSVIDYRDVLAAVCNAAVADLTPTRRMIIDELAIERANRMAGILRDVDDVVREMLHGLRSSGIALAVISNCAVEEVLAWEESPLAPMIDAPVFSCHVGYAKPDPEIYRLACRRLGISPIDAVFVGDGGSDELPGAERAGLRPYAARWFTNRWSGEARASVATRTTGFPALNSPSDVISAIVRRS